MAPDRTVVKRGEGSLFFSPPKGREVHHEPDPAAAPPASPATSPRASPEEGSGLRLSERRTGGEPLRRRRQGTAVRGRDHERVHGPTNKAPPRPGRSHSRRRSRLDHPEGRRTGRGERPDLRRPACRPRRGTTALHPRALRLRLRSSVLKTARTSENAVNAKFGPRLRLR